jgi:Domain of unknown function (DUF4440)
MKRINLIGKSLLISAAFLLVIFHWTIFAAGKKSDDEKQIIKLELKWLGSLHSKAALETILAPDFIHPVQQGIFLTKEQHINWAVDHPNLEGIIQKFDTLFVRIYGNTGIASGIVATLNKNGKLIRRSIFTDVFIRRKGKWQAVNAQENLIK